MVEQMSRVFAPISEDDLRAKVLEKFGDDGYIEHHRLGEDRIVSKDLKVEFDWENFECEKRSYHQPGGHPCDITLGIHTLENGLTFWGMYAGGDWEHPVTFILYWDGQNIRAYIPTEGNPWNTDTNKAYGNGMDWNDTENKDLLNAHKRWPDLYPVDEDTDHEAWEIDFDSDYVKMIEDIKNRIKPSSTALPLGTRPKCLVSIAHMYAHPMNDKFRMTKLGLNEEHLVVTGDHYDPVVLGFHIPVGATVPKELLEDMWLVGKLSGSKKNKVKAKNMGGVVSDGLFYGSQYYEIKDGQKVLVKSRAWNENWKVGDDVAEELGIT
jgi:hypothetical protein